MYLPKKLPHRLMLLPKWKSDSGSVPVSSQFLTLGPDPGPKEKRRILPESTPALRIWCKFWYPSEVFGLNFI